MYGAADRLIRSFGVMMLLSVALAGLAWGHLLHQGMKRLTCITQMFDPEKVPGFLMQPVWLSPAAAVPGDDDMSRQVMQGACQ